MNNRTFSFESNRSITFFLSVPVKCWVLILRWSSGSSLPPLRAKVTPRRRTISLLTSSTHYKKSSSISLRLLMYKFLSCFICLKLSRCSSTCALRILIVSTYVTSLSLSLSRLSSSSRILYTGVMSSNFSCLAYSVITFAACYGASIWVGSPFPIALSTSYLGTSRVPNLVR